MKQALLEPNRVPSGAIADEVRLVHITDLHCDASDDWREMFEELVDCVRNVKPHALLVTGDIADHPRGKFFAFFEQSLTELYDSVKEDCERTAERLRRFTIVVSGNHDVAWFGNRVGFGPKKQFHEFQRSVLTRANFKSVEDQVRNFFLETGVAIFPFDSNSFDSRLSGWAAHGHIGDLSACADRLRRTFIAAAATNEELSYEDATKIALLHHHPLPLPASAADAVLEPFMLLDNANHFLREATELGIHLVLHGHRHVSGLCKFASAEHPDNTLVVSSCGSSCKPDECEREIGVFTARFCGSISRESYIGTQRSRSFTRRGEHVEAVSYAYRRKMRRARLQITSNDPIESVRSKSKVVRLIKDGSALVTIRLQGIRWKPNTNYDDFALREFVHGGIGRVVGGWISWLDSSGERLGREAKLHDVVNSLGDEFESMFIKVDRTNCRAPQEPDGCEISYVLFNGYCLTERDHSETFGTQLADEVSSVEVLYPTEYLELILAFPDRTVMPRVDHVVLDCWRWKSSTPLEDIRIANRSYEVDDDETDYLLERDAVRHRSELCQVAALIRHPQRRRTYTLRWDLPPQRMHPTTEPREDHFETFSTALLGQNIPSERWARVQDVIEAIFGRGSMKLRVYAFDEESHRMRLVYPNAAPGEQTELVVGRGVVGHAFRSRCPAYFRKNRNRLSPIELMGVEGNISEILAVPILHPLEFWCQPNSALLEPKSIFERVSGVIAVVRRSPVEDAGALDPKEYEEGAPLISLISSVVLEPLLELIRNGYNHAQTPENSNA